MWCPISPSGNYPIVCSLLPIFLLIWIIIAPLLIVQRLDKIIKLLEKK